MSILSSENSFTEKGSLVIGEDKKKWILNHLAAALPKCRMSLVFLDDVVGELGTSASQVIFNKDC
jgi:hypothetical protein